MQNISSRTAYAILYFNQNPCNSSCGFSTIRKTWFTSKRLQLSPVWPWRLPRHGRRHAFWTIVCIMDGCGWQRTTPVSIESDWDVLKKAAPGGTQGVPQSNTRTPPCIAITCARCSPTANCITAMPGLWLSSILSTVLESIFRSLLISALCMKSSVFKSSTFFSSPLASWMIDPFMK